MRLLGASLVLVAVLGSGCNTRPAAPAMAPNSATASEDCPLADPYLVDLPIAGRSSMADPFRVARFKPYEDWNEYDRGVAITILDADFPNLTEEMVLDGVFSSSTNRTSQFRQWLQLQGFSPSLVVFLLRNYTNEPVASLTARAREELRQWGGGPRFNQWLTIATSLDPSPEQTHELLTLLLAEHVAPASEGACRFGSWCHDHLDVDLTPTEAAEAIRNFADQDTDISPLFADPAAIFATDPSGFTTDAARGDVRGFAAARLLLGSGDLDVISAFLRDSDVHSHIRAYWAFQLGSDPPPDSTALLASLSKDSTLPAMVREALSWPGTVPGPYVSCSDRLKLLEAEKDP
ncbi:MAG: hypothetical protein ABI743_01805 [bacterium]